MARQSSAWAPTSVQILNGSYDPQPTFGANLKTYAAVDG
jgi:hypothetical protein